MRKLENAIGLIQDKPTKDALIIILDELKRIKQTPKATEDIKSLTLIINKITGKIK